jgi:ubiquitin C-terminal hydrolase
METNLTETRPSATDPVDFGQTLDESSPTSPPNQALDDLTNFSSLPAQFDLDYPSNTATPSNDETKDTESRQEKEDMDDNYNDAPVSSSTWSEEWQWHGETDLSKSFVGAGLANMGNTCFLNAILQCFTHTVTLIQGLWSCNHAIPCDKDGFCVLCAFREHIELSLAYSGRVISPAKLVDNLRYISSSFCRYEQEDAHEFLQCFLDRLESCSTHSNAKDDNFVKQGFGGRLISRLRCCNCNHLSDTYEPSIDLSLEIEDVDSLATALESFTKIEKIEDPEAKFTCENCKQQVVVEKQLKLEEVPKVAALHLKRFKNDGSFVEKIDKHLDFPLDLDLRPFSSDNSNDDEYKYDLYAIVVHTGSSSTSGHYYCFIRSAPDTWYKFDDSKVIRVREAYVLSQEAYILFYAKQGTAWFSTFMETEKEKSPSFCQNISSTSPKSVLENVDKAPALSPNFVIKSSYVQNECMDVKDNSPDWHTPLIKSLNTDSSKFEKIEKRFSLQDFDKKRAFSDCKIDDVVVPRTPLRSPSPDIYDDEPAELEVKITKPKNHEKMVKKVSCKQATENAEFELARKRCKIMGSRGAAILASIDMSRSEDSGKSKKARSKLLSPRAVTRPLTAGSNR